MNRFEAARSSRKTPMRHKGYPNKRKQINTRQRRRKMENYTRDNRGTFSSLVLTLKSRLETKTQQESTPKRTATHGALPSRDRQVPSPTSYTQQPPTRKRNTKQDAHATTTHPHPSQPPLPHLPVTSWNGLVEISCPAAATPMMHDSPHPRCAASRAARMTPVFPVASNV